MILISSTKSIVKDLESKLKSMNIDAFLEPSSDNTHPHIEAFQASKLKARTDCNPSLYVGKFNPPI